MNITNLRDLATTPARRLALEIAEAAIAAVSPANLIPRCLRLEGSVLVASAPSGPSLRFPLHGRRLWLLGAGKASVAMALAVEGLLGPARIYRGAVIGRAGEGERLPKAVQLLPGSHPLPDGTSVESTRALLRMTEGMTEQDLVLWLISGGASAMLTAPAPGLTLTDKQASTQVLLRSGASIDEMNIVRRHLSAVKGGQLACHLAPAEVLTLALSDVVSGRPETVGSGPTLPDPTTFAAALAVLDRYRLRDRVPTAVARHLEAGARGDVPETPKPGDPRLGGAHTAVIGSPALLAAEAARAAAGAGARAEVLTDRLEGDAEEAAGMLAAALHRLRRGEPLGPWPSSGVVNESARGEPVEPRAWERIPLVLRQAQDERQELRDLSGSEDARRRSGIVPSPSMGQGEGEGEGEDAGRTSPSPSESRSEPRVLIATGEVTVRVRGGGRGGRCQHLAAALIPAVAGLPGCAVACVASDGSDYLPGAGGAVVDSGTAAAARAAGIDVAAALADNATHDLHRALGTLIEMRPTGTNVCDLIVAVVSA